MTHYRLKLIHSLDQDSAELFYLQTDELIARGTPEEVEKVFARLIREAHRKQRMVDNPVWEICERVAEVQALLHDHIEGGKHGLTKRISITHTAPTQPRRNPICCGRCSRYFPPNTPRHTLFISSNWRA